MRFFPLFPVLCLFLQQAAAADIAAIDLEPCFKKLKVNGTFVLMELKGDGINICHQARAGQRYIPASTFKIPNTLIGLETGAVKSVDEVLPYGGKPQPVKDWEHDMPLREAIRLSAVPIYQELARRIGLERMREKVRAFNYGNSEIGTVVDEFWLKGPLKISAFEEADFLARMLQGRLPVKPPSVAAVKEITLRETSAGRELHYKTGWGLMPGQPGVGWLVGWVTEKQGETCTFALNMDMAAMEDAPKRLELAKECLKALGEYE